MTRIAVLGVLVVLGAMNQQFMTDFVAAVQDAKKAGRSVDEAVSAINLSSKYTGYRNERYKAAIQAIYDELK